MNIRTSLVRQLPRIRAIDMCDGHFFKPPGISFKGRACRRSCKLDFFLAQQLLGLIWEVAKKVTANGQ